MKRFLRLDKWELNNELFTGLHFTAMLSMYSIIVLIHGGRSVDIFIMFQILLLCYALPIFQKLIFTDDISYSKKTLFVKTGVWFAFSMILVFVTSIIFKWFDTMDSWASCAFLAYMVIYFIAIWIGIHIANKIDTKHLNNMLSHYQEKRM